MMFSVVCCFRVSRSSEFVDGPLCVVVTDYWLTRLLSFKATLIVSYVSVCLCVSVCRQLWC